MKISKIGKTRKDTRWNRGEFVAAERVRKQSGSEDGGMRDKPGCQDHQKHLKEGRKVRCNQEVEEWRDRKE